MKTTKLSMKNGADVNTLYNLLNEMLNSNKVFTIHFVKKSGEPRIINGVAKNYRNVKGTGTPRMTASSKRARYNVFQCWEVQITKAERKLTEDLMLNPKTTGYKCIQIDNITFVKFQGQRFKIRDNQYVLDPKKIEQYRREVHKNTLLFGKKLKALNEVIDASLILR